MKPGDVVKSKEINKSVGVMGSSLRLAKIFEGFAIVLSKNHNSKHIMIMKASGETMLIKASFLELVIDSQNIKE